MDHNQIVNKGGWINDFDLLVSWVRYVNRNYHLPHCIQAYNSPVVVPLEELDLAIQS